MNLRTCQFCGKPLSRLRVGGDGDFCSKEHRNQFRLRQGMDRLEEVNKVASLLRRRESPRHFNTAQLLCNSANEARGFMEARLMRLGAAPQMISPGFAPPAKLRVVSISVDVQAGHPKARRGETQRPRSHPAVVRITARDNTPELPQRRIAMTASVRRAPARQLRFPARPGASKQRDFGLLRQRGMRVHLGGRPQSLRSVARGAAALGTTRPATAIGGRPVKGNALRVSSAVGFRIGKVRLAERPNAKLIAAAMIWPDTPRVLRGSIVDHISVHRTLGPAVPKRARRLPAGPTDSRGAHFDYPGAIHYNGRGARKGITPDKRSSKVSWMPADPIWSGSPISPPASGFSARNGVHLFRLAMMPMATEAGQRLSGLPFAPADSLFIPTVSFQGTIAGALLAPGGLTGTPADLGGASATPEAAAVKAAPVETPQVAINFEEHFEGGWDNWVGGVSDWKVDVAGVRAGSLALYLPTLDLSDYELEFLSRIDAHTVNWVIRAAGLDHYVRCTLTAADGQLEFSRTLVKGGTAESPVISAKRVPGKPRTAMTVRTRVSGATFSVSVDGNTIDTWIDDRIMQGGVGFLGVDNDRARLYWVKISSTASSTKEYPKR